MSIKRIKFDWAYKQAARLIIDGVFKDQGDQIRRITTLLRRAEKRGRLEQARSTPGLYRTVRKEKPVLTTAAIIRECQKQLVAQEVREVAERLTAAGQPVCVPCAEGNDAFHGYHYGDRIAEKCIRREPTKC